MGEAYHKEQLSLWDDALERIVSPSRVSDLLAGCPKNGEIQSTMVKCFDNIQDHDKIMCAVSGGYDSDIMMDLIVRCGGSQKTDFYWYDTGLEYDATREHISFLELRYGVKIQTVKPKLAIPLCVKNYGVPFLSKYTSDMISRLQRHGFKWEYGELEDLTEKYERCSSALRWWCNGWGDGSRFNIGYTQGLKEFIHENPPPMKISAMCCTKAKKEPAKKLENSGYDLVCTGVRRAEGGKRATAYKSCFDRERFGADRYRPLFWWSESDKDDYRIRYGIVRSDCYEAWGMIRTGCAGCPFGKEFEAELDLVRTFEPKRYAATLSVFGKSYDYTREFLAFREKRKLKPKKSDQEQFEMEGVR